MQEKIVLKGIARARGRASGEALVSEMNLSWAPCSVLNNGTIRAYGNPLNGENVKGKIVVYPTVTGSTSGAFSLLFKVKHNKTGPTGILCKDVHYIDVAGCLASDIPAIDSFEVNPVTFIHTGDWVEIQADEVGKEATVTITRKA